MLRGSISSPPLPAAGGGGMTFHSQLKQRGQYYVVFELLIRLSTQNIQSARVSGRSSELAPPTPSTASEYVPPGSKWRGHTIACGKGVEGANSDEGTDTVVLFTSILIPSLCLSPWNMYLKNRMVII